MSASSLLVGSVVFVTTIIAAGILAARRSVRSGAILLAFYVLQGLVVLWIAHAIDSLVLACALCAAWTLVMVHRVLTYAHAASSRSWDLLVFVPVHVAQTTFLLWLIAWPISRSLAVVAGVPLVAAFALALTHRMPAMREVSLDVPGFSEELRVVQISDLHVGPYMGPTRLSRIAAAVNASPSDLIVMTGDFLTLRSELDYTPLLDFVRALDRPPLGIYACLGNHDLAVRQRLVADLERAGVRVLVDAAEVVVTPSGAALRIAGLDYHHDRSRYAVAFDALGTSMREPTVLLCHHPGAFPVIRDRLHGLMLAGHFHGGQIGLTSLGLPCSVLRPFGVLDQGVFAFGGARLYCHRGTGVYGFPVRLGVPSEIAVLRLVPSGARA